MKLYIHIIVAFLALAIGYPYGGTNFILLMAPYLVYMVLKCDAIFLPALMLHCASETSATSIVFISFIILSIIRVKELSALRLGRLFWVLMGMIPIFVWLVVSSITKYGMYPPLAVSQIGYYLSFFAFFYGVLVSNTFSKSVLNSIYVTLFIAYILYVSGIIEFTRIIVGFSFLFASALAIYLSFKTKNLILLPFSVFAFLSVILITEESTLTTLSVSILSLLLAYLYFKDKTRLIQRITGIIPFIIIVLIYFIGISGYLSADRSSTPDKLNISGFRDIRNWIYYKVFFDRAAFWAGGFNQILDYKHLFPIPEMPDIVAVLKNRAEVEITFGSHTTMIELIRKYGIIAGVMLNVCLVYIVVISRKVMRIYEINPFMIPLFAMSIVTTIVLTLTGQYQIMPGYAILSMGILGVAYSTYSENILLE